MMKFLILALMTGSAYAALPPPVNCQNNMYKYYISFTWKGNREDPDAMGQQAFFTCLAKPITTDGELRTLNDSIELNPRETTIIFNTILPMFEPRPQVIEVPMPASMMSSTKKKK